MSTEYTEVENRLNDALTACKGALAALGQNKTYPADIEAARSFLSDIVDKEGE